MLQRNSTHISSFFQRHDFYSLPIIWWWAEPTSAVLLILKIVIVPLLVREWVEFGGKKLPPLLDHCFLKICRAKGLRRVTLLVAPSSAAPGRRNVIVDSQAVCTGGYDKTEKIPQTFIATHCCMQHVYCTWCIQWQGFEWQWNDHVPFLCSTCRPASRSTSIHTSTHVRPQCPWGQKLPPIRGKRTNLTYVLMFLNPGTSDTRTCVEPADCRLGHLTSVGDLRMMSSTTWLGRRLPNLSSRGLLSIIGPDVRGSRFTLMGMPLFLVMLWYSFCHCCRWTLFRTENIFSPEVSAKFWLEQYTRVRLHRLCSGLFLP